MKRNVYFAQVNNTYGKNAFLPYSVGLLQAFCLADPVIAANYDFRGFFFLREDIKTAVARMDPPPDVVGASLYIWNAEYTLALVREIKRVFPKCLIVLGGPHVPNRCSNYFHEHPYVDVLVHAEGELTFREILAFHALGTSALGATGCSVRMPSNACATQPPRERIKDLVILPSPYLTGVFDALMELPYDFHGSQETNRGCPFLCTMCIVSDSMVITKSGVKQVVDVVTGDQVLGWDETSGCQAWNTVEHLASRGRRPVLRISIGNSHVEATKDHPFFTRRGWINAGELRIGDEVLYCAPVQNVRSGDYAEDHQGRESPVHEDVFAGVREGRYCRGEDRRRESDEASRRAGSRQRDDDRELLGDELGEAEGLARGRQDASSANVRGGKDGYVGQDEEVQSDAACRCRGEAGRDAEGQDRQWRVRAVDADGGGAEDDRQDREGAAIGSGESDEGREDQSQSRPYQQPAEFSEDLGSNDSTEPDEESEVQSIGSGVDGRSGSREAVCGGMRGSSEPLRTAGHRLPGTVEPAVQLHRGLHVLGTAQTVGGGEESGLRSFRSNDEEDHSGSRRLLASGREGDRSRVGVLPEGRLGVLHHLGERGVRCRDGQADHGVRWSRVVAIIEVGVAEVYDLVNATPTHNFFANGVLVSNCDWGSNTFAKLKQFTVDRLVSEVEWFAERKVDLLYNCDANYGIFDRDLELTERMVEIRQRLGFPKKFRAAYAKNSNERVFQISQLLQDAGMNKGVTLSFQSLHKPTLEAIKRVNMKTNDFKGLIQRYNAAGIATYSEIIIGLPEETYESFANGLNTLAENGQHQSMSVYTCECLPNSEMSDPAYLEKYGIETVRTPVLVYHGTPIDDPHREYYDIVVATKTLPPDEWMLCQLIAWAFQAFHCMNLTQCIAVFYRTYNGVPYRTFYERMLVFGDEHPRSTLGKAVAAARQAFEDFRDGKEAGFVDQRFGNITWPLEEAGFLTCAADYDDFICDIDDVLKLWDVSESMSSELVNDVMNYQEASSVLPWSPAKSEISQEYNIHDYLLAAYAGAPAMLRLAPHRLSTRRPETFDDLETWARRCWYARKGGQFRYTDMTVMPFSGGK